MRRWLVCTVILAGVLWCAPHGNADDVKFDWGYTQRARQEFWQDVFDFNSDVSKNDNFFRFKSTLWGKVDFSPQVSLYAALTNESRYYLTSRRKPGEYFDSDELVVDNLYLDFKKLLDGKLDIRLGRQNLFIGGLLLFADGTPGDGSRTFYFNALRTTWRVTPAASLDFIYIDNPRTDIYLPVWNDEKKALNVSDERAVALYGSIKANDCLTVEPYVVHKTEEAVDADGDLNLETVGSRVVWSRTPSALRAELAWQFGEYDSGVNRNGLAATLFYDRSFPAAKGKPKLTLGGIYLSGENIPQRGWDPLFSRYPWFSEGFGLSQMYYWSNISSLQAGAKWMLTDKVALEILEAYLWANDYYDHAFTRELAGIGPLLNTGPDRSKDRGFLSTAKVSWKAAKWLDTYLLLEYFQPDDFYAPTAQDPSFFLRWEMMFRF